MPTINETDIDLLFSIFAEELVTVARNISARHADINNPYPPPTPDEEIARVRARMLTKWKQVRG